MNKPTWLTKKVTLQIALALIAAGLFTPVYTVVENTIGKDRAAELLAWGLSEKAEAEQEIANPPVATNNPSTKPPVVDTPAQQGDDLDISRAILVCQNSANNISGLASIPALHTITSAQIQGSNVRLAYNVPSSYWSSTTDHRGFARGFVFWREGGQVYGSHFDWFRPGQTVKTLGNLYNGYVTRRPTGQLYFCLIANNKSARTNVKASK